MKFDIDHVLKRYGTTVLGEAIVHFPSRNPTCLLVCFSAMDSENRFNRLSWFWDEEEQWGDGCSVLYIRDEQYTYYLGNNAKPKYHTYEKIIDHVLAKNGLQREHAFGVGSSMGGYAAILFAFRMALGGSIVGVPQVNKRCARMHQYANWIRSINSTEDQWVELDEVLYRPDIPLPKLYLEYGRYPADYMAAESLLTVYRERGGLVVAHKGPKAEHVNFMSPATVHASVAFLKSMAVLT